MDPLPRAEYLASLPRKRVITSALVVDDDGRVLCVEPTYKDTWHLPGGTVEQRESPERACVRECREELGVEVDLGRLLAVGLLPDDPQDPDGCPAFVYSARLPAGITIDDLVVPPDELRGVHWLDHAGRAGVLSENAIAFVAAGLAALRTGGLVEFDRPQR